MRPTDVAGVVLAAGEGRRFGGFKALACYQGTRMVDLAVVALAQAGVTERLVVTHPGWPTSSYDEVDATVAVNPDWAQGMGSSLRLALGHPLAQGRSGAVLLLADQPLVGSACVSRVLVAASGTDALVQATYSGRRGHPVLIGAEHWAGVVAGAAGDVGARPYLAGHAAQVVLVDCADIGHDADVDTVEELGALAARRPSGRT